MDKKNRFLTFMLSAIPGLGHFYLGLMNRGAQFMVIFFLNVALIFFAQRVNIEPFSIFFIVSIPIVWFYALFDAMNMLAKFRRTGEWEDKNILNLETLEFETDRKNKFWAFVLSFIPGLGHLYLGQPQRGLQIMATFFLSLFLMDYLRISIFFFALPVLWFYGLFDVLQQAARYTETGEVRDEPFLPWKTLRLRQQWIGYGLIAIGVFALFDNIALPYLEEILRFPIRQYLQTLLVSFILILAGLRLVMGKKQKIERKEDDFS